MRALWIPVAGMIALSAQADTPTKRFVNTDYGYQVLLPQAAQRVNPKDRRLDDVTFRLDSGKMDLWIHAERLPSDEGSTERLAKVQRSIVGNVGDKLVLNVRRPGFVATSWRENDTIHYRKDIAKNGMYARLYLIYPASKKKAMDPVVVQASRSFGFR